MMRTEPISLAVEGPTPEATPQGRGEIVLAGELADLYVARFARALRAARLNRFFPPPRTLATHFSFLGPTGSRGLYSELRLSQLNGLPTAREILRVKIDRDLATQFLRSAAAQRVPPPDSSMARRIEYYQALGGQQVMPVNRMQVELRQQLPQEDLALFRVTFDRFDLAATQFVRYTILLGQRDRFWGKQHVAVERDLAAATEGFRRTVSRFASHEAELAFVLLSELDAIEVEDVRRCRVGPLLLPGARVGGPFEQLLRSAADGELPRWILCCPEDRAGVEVSDNAGSDPFAPLMRDVLGAHSRELLDAKADQLGYRVAKARKFVCPQTLKPLLAQLCRELGAPSIVRGA